MRAVLRKAVAVVRRRRLRSAAVAGVVLLASLTATVGLDLLAVSDAPFIRAFEEQRGPHLVAFFDASMAAPAQLEATAAAVGAATAGGPWPGIAAVLQRGAAKLSLQVVGRDDPGGEIARVRVVEGRWPAAPGELAVTRSFAELFGVSVGDELVALTVPSKPTLAVVGIAIDVAEGPADFATQWSWVTRAQLLALAPGGVPAYWQMVYRWSAAPAAADLDRTVGAIKAALPSGALTDTLTHLQIARLFGSFNAIVLTILLALGTFALVAAAAIVANLVLGIVIAGYREIGILKAIGFTPAQVVATFALQMIVPAVAGAAAGIPAGLVLSQPLVARTAHVLGVPAPLASSPAAAVAVLGGVLLVVGLAATLPALRAGRLSPARAIALGSAPQEGRGSWFARYVGRLPLPRPLSLGASSAFVRPLRGALAVIAVVLGVATLAFAVGMHETLARLSAASSLEGTVHVRVARIGQYADERAAALIASQPGTRNVVAVATTRVLVAGLAEPVLALAHRGDAERLGYKLVDGRWYAKPGEVVTQAGFLEEAKLRIGDAFTAQVEGRAVELRVVGVDFDATNFGRVLRMDWTTYASAARDPQAQSYLVQLDDGADAAGYVERLQRAEPDFLVAQVNRARATSPLRLLDQVVLGVAAVLALLAVAAVMNTMVLNARERARDTAVLKALGMTPGQVIAMIVASAAALGIVGAVVGVPMGIALFRGVLGYASRSLGNQLPTDVLDVFTPTTVAAIAAAGLTAAVIGAMLPARWAARLPTAKVLQAE